MGEKYKSLKPEHIDFINEQHIFFVATADKSSKINLSPKGLDTLKIIDNNLVIWLNKTGSGNETAAHIQHSENNPRMTIMLCSFTQKPVILKMYGKAIEIRKESEKWNNLIALFDNPIGARQIFALDIDLVQTSCGFGVPYFEFKGEREMLDNWANNKGKEGLREYQRQKNSTSLDGKNIEI